MSSYLMQPLRDEWERPVPLGSIASLPSFPVSALPGWVGAYVSALADSTQTPVDLAGVMALAALATAVGGRAVVEVRPGWREPTNLFVVVAMPPGSRKSAVVAAISEPLLAADRSLVERAIPEIADAEASRQTAINMAAAARAAAKSDDEAMRAAVEAMLTAEAMTVPKLPRLLADDATPEALTSLMADQGGRIAMLSAEGDVFDIMAGRYSQATGNLGVYLKGHAGDMIRVDRKGRPPEFIARPALTLGLAVQPDVLRAIADRPGFRGRGLLARFLYSLPANNVGRRRIGRPGPSDDIATEYADALHELVMSLAEWSDPAVLMVTADANDRLLDYEARLEPRLAPLSDYGDIADWGAKLAGAAVRIAGLLHLAERRRVGWQAPICAETMGDALDLADYFAGHALAVFDLMGADPVVEHARAVLSWIATTRTHEFSRRDCHRALQHRVSTVADLDPVLDLLVAHGFLRPLADQPSSPRGGRPASRRYEVNPLVSHDGDEADVTRHNPSRTGLPSGSVASVPVTSSDGEPDHPPLQVSPTVLGPCVYCGTDCRTIDDSGHIRHPNCPGSSPETDKHPRKDR